MGLFVKVCVWAVCEGVCGLFVKVCGWAVCEGVWVGFL